MFIFNHKQVPEGKGDEKVHFLQNSKHKVKKF